MRVLLELSERSLDFISNIPEDQVPSILSNVLEEALESKINSLQQPAPSTIRVESDTDSTRIIDMLKEIMGKLSDSSNINEVKESVAKVVKPVVETIAVSDDDTSDIEDYFDLLK